MSTPNPGYAITVRVQAPAAAGMIGDLTTAIGKAGGVVTALDVVESHADRIVVDVTCNAADAAHVDVITEAIGALDGVDVAQGQRPDVPACTSAARSRSTPKVPLRNRDDLSRAYTPGVARVCLAIAENPDDARRLTIKRNTVAVVTDGSAVLGLGNIGPAAALPVMEGKAALFKRFAGVDAWPVCLDTQDTDEIVEIVRAIAPVYGGINLEDIAAPRCFEIEAPAARAARHPGVPRRPARHRDRRAGRAHQRAAGGGQGAAPTCGSSSRAPAPPGTAIIRLLLRAGRAATSSRATPAAPCTAGRDGLDRDHGRGSRENTNPRRLAGDLPRRLAGADVFIGVSRAEPAHRRRRRHDGRAARSCSRWPTPTPRSTRARRSGTPRSSATGRCDYPNQINNVLAFPGVFRGLLDAGAEEITDEMLVAAARAIADAVRPDKLNPSYIVPSVFDPRGGARRSRPPSARWPRPRAGPARTSTACEWVS